MAIEAVDAALDTIAAYLNTALPGTLTAMTGWPEANVKYDDTLPLVAVTGGDPQVELMAPRLVEQSGSGTLTATYKIALVTFGVQLDLWTAHRRTRAVVGAAMGAKLHNGLPHRSGLWLTQGNYYSRPLSIDWTGQVDTSDGDTAAKKQWRRMWEGEVTTDWVVQTTLPEAISIVLRLSTSLGGVSVTEPDLNIP